MSKKEILKARLLALAQTWEEESQKRRRDGDAEADKVWAARQYGFADALDDAARHIRLVIVPETHEDLGFLMKEWEILAAQAQHFTEQDDNRLTCTYRRAGAERYPRTIGQLEQVIQQVGIDG